MLLMIDVQERLLPAMHDRDAVLRNGAILLKTAARLEIPVLISEQYPRGLGPTVAELRSLANAEAAVGKLCFSCHGEPALRDRIAAQGREQIVIFGIEAHVCVLQSALDFRTAGKAVFVVADAVSSRVSANRRLALARMRQEGVRIVSTEMVLFEWLRRAGTDEFREISGLIK